MRRLSLMLLAAAALGWAALLVLSPPSVTPFRLAQLGVQSIRIGDRLATTVARGLGGMMCRSAREAGAQEVLQFKALPPESVSKLERRRGRRVVRVEPEQAAPEPESEPVPPEPDTPPAPPAPTAIPEISRTGDIMRIGSDVHVEAGQVVDGDLLAVGGDVTIDGHVEGDVVAMGGDVQLNSTARVDGDVAAMGGELTEEPGAWVGGQRVTASGVKAMRHRARERARDITHRSVRGATRTATHVATSMIWLLIMMGVAWGFSRIAPGRTGAALETLKHETALSIGIGALIWALIVPSLVALCLVVAILCITIIGIPVALAALFGYALFLGMLWVWGYVVSACAVGDWVLRRRSAALAGGGTLAAPGVAMPAEPTLVRKAIVGVLIISGAGFVGEMLKATFFLHGLGTFIAVVSMVAGALAATFGAGAWLRTEIVSGTLRRWWGGRRTPLAGAPAASMPPAPLTEPVAPPPPPQV